MVVGPDNLCRLILLQILLSLGTLISMAHILCFLFSVLTSTFRSRLSLQLEIAALRHQLPAYRYKGQRPRIVPPERLIWSVLAKFWSRWRNVLFFAQPQIVAELRKLGIEVVKSTVEKYKPHGERLPSVTWRTHRSLGQDAPDGRRVRLAGLGQIAEFPVAQGLHHHYLPRAA